jgi:uncharacterized repeat protein (TIGR02543 family)
LTLGLLALGVRPAVAQPTVLITGVESAFPSTYSPPQDSFNVSRTADGGISVHVSTPLGPTAPFGLAHDMSFSSGDGQPLAAGEYLSATHYPAPFNGLRVQVWDVSPVRGDCLGLTGRFLVRDVSYATDGTVLRLAVDLEYHCMDASQGEMWVLRYNSSVPNDHFPGDTARYSITIVSPPHGIVTGTGVSCGGGHTVCTMTFATATSATLTAIPDSGYVFMGWTGGCAGASTTVVNVNTVKECGATFATDIPSEPRTSLVLDGAVGHRVLNGRTVIYSPANSRWSTVHGDIANGDLVRLSVWGLAFPSNIQWALSFRAPPGTPLRVGRYTNAIDPSDLQPGKPGLSVTSACPVYMVGGVAIKETGDFVINQIEFNTDGSLRAFAADFEHHCVNGFTMELDPAIRGTVYYNATLGMVPCSTPDPFAFLGGGICYNGGWLPPGMSLPSTGGNPPPPPQPPPPPAGCTTPDPFTALGGGTCFNGGWLPPGMPTPGGGSNPPPPPTGCTIPDPFVSLGGGTCRNGGWLPPGMG